MTLPPLELFWEFIRFGDANRPLAPSPKKTRFFLLRKFKLSEDLYQNKAPRIAYQIWWSMSWFKSSSI